MTKKKFQTHFPKRDRFLKKSTKTLETFEKLEMQVEEIKTELLDFLLYSQAIKLKAMQSKLKTLKTKYKEIDENFFKPPSHK